MTKHYATYLHAFTCTLLGGGIGALEDVVDLDTDDCEIRLAIAFGVADAKIPEVRTLGSLTKMIERALAPAAAAMSDAERQARASLDEIGDDDPSVALLRAQMMLDHAKNARDLAHGWPEMLAIGKHGLDALDRAEEVSRAAWSRVLGGEVTKRASAVEDLTESSGLPLTGTVGEVLCGR